MTRETITVELTRDEVMALIDEVMALMSGDVNEREFLRDAERKLREALDLPDWGPVLWDAFKTWRGDRSK